MGQDWLVHLLEWQRQVMRRGLEVFQAEVQTDMHGHIARII